MEPILAAIEEYRMGQVSLRELHKFTDSYGLDPHMTNTILACVMAEATRDAS